MKTGLCLCIYLFTFTIFYHIVNFIITFYSFYLQFTQNRTSFNLFTCTYIQKMLIKSSSASFVNSLSQSSSRFSTNFVRQPTCGYCFDQITYRTYSTVVLSSLYLHKYTYKSDIVLLHQCRCLQ